MFITIIGILFFSSFPAQGSKSNQEAIDTSKKHSVGIIFQEKGSHYYRQMFHGDKGLVDAYITFDSKIKNKFKINKNELTKCRFPSRHFQTLSKSINISYPKIESHWIESRPLLTTTFRKFKDPLAWKPGIPSKKKIENAKLYANGLITTRACNKIRYKEFNNVEPSHLKFDKAYQSKSKDSLIGFRVQYKKLIYPNGLSPKFCWDEEAPLHIQAIKRGIFWVYLPKSGVGQFIGEGTPIDAGDYFGTGKSNFVFVYFEKSFSTYSVPGEIRFYSENFSDYKKYKYNPLKQCD